MISENSYFEAKLLELKEEDCWVEGDKKVGSVSNSQPTGYEASMKRARLSLPDMKQVLKLRISP